MPLQINRHESVISAAVLTTATTTADLDVQGWSNIYVTGKTSSAAADMDLKVFPYQLVTGTLLNETAVASTTSKQYPWLAVDVAGLDKIQITAKNNNGSTATLTVTVGGQ